MAVVQMSRIVEQRSRALSKANASRSKPAALRAQMRGLSHRDAALLAARVLIEEPERLGAVRVHKLLESVPRLGEVRVREILSRERIWPLRMVRSLSQRQRMVLAGHLVRHASRLGVGGHER